jgi:sec-independent protein translocase protein TatA
MGAALDNPVHIAILALVLILVFGAKRLPELGRSLGAGLYQFKEAVLGRGDDPASREIPEPSEPKTSDT